MIQLQEIGIIYITFFNNNKIYKDQKWLLDYRFLVDHMMLFL